MTDAIDFSFTLEPDGTRVRKLVRPIRGHEGEITELRLRPPKYGEYMRLGDPSALVVVDGGVMPTEDSRVIEGYLETLVPAAHSPLLAQLDYRDAVALKRAVIDFFRETSANTSTG